MIEERDPPADDRVPLHVLTGFLGSGKTTVLARLLRDPSAAGTAVLVNEVADLPLDGHLLEPLGEDVLALASGCICCELRGELHTAIGRLLDRKPERLVIETTGVANPGPMLDGLASDPVLRSRVRAGAVVTVADCLRLDDLVETEPEVRAQLDAADRIVLTKTDLAPERVASARVLLASEAPGREVREAPEGCVDPAWLLDAPPLANLVDASAVGVWLRHGPREVEERASVRARGLGIGRSFGGHGTRAHSVALDEPADVEALQLWLRLVTQLDGPRLLRVKALVECRDTGDVFALQAAGRALSPPRRLGRRPEGVRGVRAVLVTRGLEARAVEHMVAALRSAAAGRAVPTRPPSSAIEAAAPQRSRAKGAIAEEGA